jgi:hypothetical protein
VDRDDSQPMTVAEAKARLRAAAEQVRPSAWVRRHPLDALGIALLGGFVTGHLRAPSAGGLLAAEKLVVPLLVGMVRRM